MKRILITILLILALAPTATLAETNITLEQRVTELEARVERLETSAPEPPNTDGFSGHGMSQTPPITVTPPFKISWTAQVAGESGSVFIVTVVYPDKGTTAKSFGWYVEPGASSGQTGCYVEAGTYYLAVNAESWVSWNVQIE